MKTLKHLLLAIILIASYACQPKPQATSDWPQGEPAKHGFCVEKLEEARRFIIANAHTTGLMVVVGGESIFEYGNITQTSYIASVRKSVLAMLMGKYVENGTIDLDRTVGDLIASGVIPEDVDGLLPIEKQATIRHLIQSRSGVYHNASNAGDDAARRPARGSKQPGEFYLYNNWDFNIAGTIFENLVGRLIYEVFMDDIAIPIGMQDYDLANQVKRGDFSQSLFPAYHFDFSTRDMARIGYLMLRGGRWGDQQIISPEWMQEMLTIYTPKSEIMLTRPHRPLFGYSYMWWIFDVENDPVLEGAYTGTGYMGQFITVIPALDMVIAHKTDEVYRRYTPWNQYYTFVRMVIDAKITN